MNKQEAIRFLLLYRNRTEDPMDTHFTAQEVLFRQYLIYAPEQDIIGLLEMYEALMLGNEASISDRASLAELIETLLERRLDAIDKEKSERSIFIKSTVKSILYKVCAAAVIVLTISILGYIFIANKYFKSNEIVAIMDDIAPGGNRAVLMLEDGSSMVLDSNGSQVIKQGGTDIYQINGQLKYEAQRDPKVMGYNILSTPKGGQFQVKLPDGTRVWLNSSSSLTYPIAFTGSDRVVKLSGQAYFEIAKDPEKPFKVKVGSMQVKVLGTQFDIMAYADENTINTTLVDGSLKVESIGKEIVLKPGNKVVLDNLTQTLVVVPADINQVVAWKSGFFEFQDTDLITIMRQIERWYDVEVIYQEVKDKNMRFGGRISRDLPLSNILMLLEGDGVNFRIEGRKVYVIK